MIEIEHFGPIQKFTYNLDKDLIITYGNNNIGKSYSMQIIYLLLKVFLRNTYINLRMYKSTPFMPYESSEFLKERLINLVKCFRDSGESAKDISDVIVQEAYKCLGYVILLDFRDSCNNTFGNLEKALEQKPMIRIKHDKFEFAIDLRSKEIKGTLDQNPVRLKKTNSAYHRSKKYADHFDIYVVSDLEQPTLLIFEQIQKKMTECLQAISMLFDGVYFLPASRSGIYSGMNAFGSIVAELSRNRAYFTRKIEFPGISEPISDYFISLSNIRLRSNEGFAKYYTRIEDDILKGKVSFNKVQNALIYKPKDMDMDFEMTEVSSMVSEISPIVAFLKYILIDRSKRGRKGKSILFIEEPEAHLHPDNQIALIEIFAELIDADVKLIMSSHSNYVFNKLNNLVLSKKLDHRRYQPIVLTDGEGGSVSKLLPIDELGADDENFIDVSQKLYYEREEIIQQLNMEG